MTREMTLLYFNFANHGTTSYVLIQPVMLVVGLALALMPKFVASALCIMALVAALGLGRS